MKNLRLTHILTVMVIILPTAVHGAQIGYLTVCGTIPGWTVRDHGHDYGCLKDGTYQTDHSNWVDPDPSDKFDYVCLDYLHDISTEADLELWHHYLSYCSPRTDTYACAKEKRYSSSGCTTCTGGYASKTDNHQTTSCRYCKPNYYYTDSGCVPCPSGQVTSGADFHQETSCKTTSPVTPPVPLGICVPVQYAASSTECKPCERGSAGSDGAPGTTHGNRVCNYCSGNFYWNETTSSCVPCPLADGEDDTLIPLLSVYKYKRPITECCKSPSTEFTDISGTYSFTAECCYSDELPLNPDAPLPSPANL